MSETPTQPSLSYNAPFGSWPKDFDWKSLSPLAGPMPLSITHTSRVDLFSQHGVVTKFYSSPEVAECIWKFMQLAGDCSVSIVGRLFLEPKSTQIMGFCTPIEAALDPVNIETRYERIRLIYQLRDLLVDLHSKQIVHGDVKPKNILMCSDGRLRFCDFDNASIEGDGFFSTSTTYPYCSTFRARNEALPMTRAEDVYAMGLTMWEIYTGKVPLTYNDETYEDAQDDLMDRCAAGFLPDMQLIDDPGVASLINSYIAAGPDRPDVCDPSPTYCVETRFVFGRCTAEPRHIYSRTVHSNQCVLRTDRGSGPCADPFVDPKVFSTPLEPICTKCNVGVEYTGLLP